MYPAPPEVEARVYATLPPELYGDPNKLEWAKTQHKGKIFKAFLEGPSLNLPFTMSSYFTRHHR